MGFCYEGRKLCCDKCGKAGASKKRCPVNYCQATALCADCRKELKGEAWKKLHVGCKEASERYHAKERERERRLAAGEYLRTSAIGLWDAKDPALHDHVEVTFENATGSKFYGVMSSELYGQISLGVPVSCEEYELHGEVIRNSGRVIRGD